MYGILGYVFFLSKIWIYCTVLSLLEMFLLGHLLIFMGDYLYVTSVSHVS